MIILNTKSFEELDNESLEGLTNLGFTDTPGSVARLFLSIINKNISDLYNTLTVNHLRSFVTTADGDALDSIGILLQCERADNEDDENYRYRITQQCLTLASSNETAVRLTALTVEGVSDVFLKPYSMGAGTFTVIVISDTTVTDNSILEEVKERLEDVHGYGIRYNVVSPTLNYIKIKQVLSIKDTCSDIKKQEIKYNVQEAIIKYINGLTIGENFITDKLTQAIMNIDNNIIEEKNDYMYINGEKALYTNQSCRWFERFCVSNDVDNVIVV